ncbi:MAG: TonB family protein [Acidobacteriota bacterium]|nr:TonB family protein [Acidobacteriota bacterium]
MMRILAVGLLLFASAASAQLAPPHAQTPAEPCSNMIYPVNQPTNRPPVPPATWRAPQSAVVWVDLTVDNRGNVKDPVIAVSGGKEADEAVLKAVRHWTFRPAVCGIQPVETRIHIKLNLAVGKPGSAPPE